MDIRDLYRALNCASRRIVLSYNSDGSVFLIAVENDEIITVNDPGNLVYEYKEYDEFFHIIDKILAIPCEDCVLYIGDPERNDSESFLKQAICRHRLANGQV